MAISTWDYDGTLETHPPRTLSPCREQAQREASPTAGVIDSQSVKSAEKRGACIDPPGYDAGKKIKGKKRHVLVDTLGLLLHAIVHPADIQDRDGGRPGYGTLFGCFRSLQDALRRWRLSRTGIRQGTWQRFFRVSTLKSSSVPTPQSVSRSYRNDGSLNAPSRGSIAADDLPKIGRISTARRSHSCASLQFASCSESYAIRPKLSGQTLS